MITTKGQVLKKECPNCGQPIYMRDKRSRTAEGIAHRECPDGTVPVRIQVTGTSRKPRSTTIVDDLFTYDDLRKVLGADEANRVIGQLWVSKRQPLTEMQIESFVGALTGEGSPVGGLVVLRDWARLHQASAKKMVEWAKATADRGGIPPELSPPGMPVPSLAQEAKRITDQEVTLRITDQEKEGLSNGSVQALPVEPDELNEVRREILGYVGPDPVTARQLAGFMKVPQSTIFTNLRALERMGLVLSKEVKGLRGMAIGWTRRG